MFFGDQNGHIPSGEEAATVKKAHSGLLSIALLAAALGLCILGAVGGEAEDVFREAINICMECIGLG